MYVLYSNCMYASIYLQVCDTYSTMTNIILRFVVIKVMNIS